MIFSLFTQRGNPTRQPNEATQRGNPTIKPRPTDQTESVKWRQMLNLS